jgi:hypothetical protein
MGTLRRFTSRGLRVVAARLRLNVRECLWRWHFRRELSSTLTQRSARVEDPSLEDLMSLVVRFAPESLTSDQYDHVVRRLDEENISPADGLDYEVCFGSGDKMKVSLVWDSKEQFDAFAARLMPILAEVGIDPGEPEVFEVHNIIKR